MKNREGIQDFREKYYEIRYEKSGKNGTCLILAHTPEEAKKTFKYGYKKVKITSIEIENSKYRR